MKKYIVSIVAASLAAFQSAVLVRTRSFRLLTPILDGTYDDGGGSADNESHGRSGIVCLSPACIADQARKLARAFPDRVDRENWCSPDQSRIILVKVPKGASSTSAAVAIRISQRLGCQMAQWKHKLAIKYADRGPESFMFTTMRDPGARSISRIFFRDSARATDKYVLKQLKGDGNVNYQFGAVSDGRGGFQLRWNSLQEIPRYSAWNSTQPTVVQNPQAVIQNVNHTMQNYDFILVTERMDESLVAMSIVMGIEVGDVLVTASKVAGSAYHYSMHKKRCTPIVRSTQSPAVKAFLESDHYRALNYGDLLMHAASNISLDLTIQRIGPERFDRAMAEFKRLRAMEQETCAPYIVMACSAEGVPQVKASAESCYIYGRDLGCGYKCVDRIVDSMANSSKMALQR